MLDIRHLREMLAGRYTIEGELGSGGMAAVYLAEDLRHGRHVALKVFAPELVDHVGRDRFRREIHITAGLSHPHIRPLLDSGEVDGALYYVMPLAEDATLEEHLEEQGRLDLDEALRLTAEVAEALAYAHAHKVVHRDVKPSNILLESGHAVLTDFGVALPLRTTGQGRITAAGDTLGTAEYMSPEQCSGDREVDARSDIYSLACVLHQMLSGSPPFVARSPVAVLAKQLRDPPPPLRTLRDDVPEAVEALVLKALEKDPEERHGTAGEFGRALSAARREPPRHATSHARLAGALLGIVLLAAVGKVSWDRTRPSPALDASRYAVLSFLHREPTRIHLTDGSDCQVRLREAIGAWDDAYPVSPTVVRDREARRGDVPMDLASALAIATDLEAGRMVWGEVWMEGEDTQVEGTLYDVASGAVIRTYRVSIARDDLPGDRFDELADTLLVGQVQTGRARASAGATRSIQALQLFEDGQQLLRRWALSEAASAFQAAADRDPGYAQASLWRSLVGVFQGEGYESWLRYAAQAAREAERLSGQDRLLARGVLGLAQAEWQQACEAFGQALARDSLSFEAWLGLGDCQARDARVEPDETSSSGWRFRSSYESAGRAYRRALELAPSYARVLQDTLSLQVEKVFETRVGNYRAGLGGEAGDQRFGGHPRLVGDTIAYVPWPVQDLVSRPFTPDILQAAQRNRAVLGEVMEGWARAFPTDALALAAHARVLEVTGRIASTGDVLTSALDAVREARRQLPSEEAEALTRLEAVEVRLLVKLGNHEEAAETADRLLDDPSPTEATAEALAGVALLRGRTNTAADLLELLAPEWVFPLVGEQERVPVPLRETALRFLVFASAGGPADSLVALRERALRQAEALLPPDQREATLTALFSDALSMAYTVIDRDPADPPAQPGDWLRAPLDALEDGVDAGREALAFWDERVGHLPVAELPASLVWEESFVRLAVGDTGRTLERLDGHLESVRSQDQRLLTPDQAGPLVRSMALRAALADASGDAATARRWAQAVVDLWRDGDPTARDVAAAMSSILEAAGR